jgi:hypothetical protein
MSWSAPKRRACDDISRVGPDQPYPSAGAVKIHSNGLSARKLAIAYPVVLGAGERVFGETSNKNPLRLVDTKTIGDGLTYVSYEMVRDS